LNGVYVIDADNTLWDTYSVFVGAYEEMVKCLKSLGCSFGDTFGISTIRVIDSYLSRTLRDYEYDFSLLALALVHVARGEAPSDAAAAVLTTPPRSSELSLARTAADRFYQYHRTHYPALYEGTTETLAALKHLNNVLVLHSEGREDRVRRDLAVHGLDQYFDYLLMQPKSQQSFAQACAAGEAFYRWVSDIPPPEYVVIGDSPQRDIVFGNMIGAKTVLKPGAFWGREIPEDPLYQPDYVISSLDEILVLR